MDRRVEVGGRAARPVPSRPRRPWGRRLPSGCSRTSRTTTTSTSVTPRCPSRIRRLRPRRSNVGATRGAWRARRGRIPAVSRGVQVARCPTVGARAVPGYRRSAWTGWIGIDAGARARRGLTGAKAGRIAGQADDAPLALELVEVRQDGQARHRVERRGDLAVRRARRCRPRSRRRRSRAWRICASRSSRWRDVALDDGPGRLEDRPVRRIDALDVQLEHPAERLEVVGEVAVVGRDHGRRAAEDQVAGEERAAPPRGSSRGGPTRVPACRSRGA